MEETKRKLGNWLSLAYLLSLAVWMLYLRHHPVRPPVGTYIAFLAFVGALVSIWPPEDKWAKGACFIVFGAFLVLEITTLSHQQSEDKESDRQKRVEEDNRFANLLKEQQRSFADVLSQNQQEFNATMGGLKETVNAATGGMGFCYVALYAYDHAGSTNLHNSCC